MNCYKFVFGVYCLLSVIKFIAVQFSENVNMNFHYNDDEIEDQETSNTVLDSEETVLLAENQEML